MHVEKYKADAMGGMLQHYERRAELERGYRRENVDPGRTALNYNLGPERLGSQADFVRARIESLGLPRAPRKDAVRFCDAVLTLPATFPATRSREFFEAAYAFLEERYGAENVVSAWVHMDESTPHMHFCWVPVTPDGRLSAKDVVGRADLKTLHGDLRDYLEPRLGVPCDVLLGDEERARKELSRLPQAEYRAARDEIARTEARLEGVRRAEEAARAAGRGAGKTVGELVRVGTGVARVRRAQEEEGRLRGEVERVEGLLEQAGRAAEEQAREIGRAEDEARRAEREVERLERAERAAGERRDAALRRVEPLRRALADAAIRIQAALKALGGVFPRGLGEWARDVLLAAGGVERPADAPVRPQDGAERAISADWHREPRTGIGGGNRGSRGRAR